MPKKHEEKPFKIALPGDPLPLKIALPGDPLPQEKLRTEQAKAARRRAGAQAGERATEAQWQLAETAIKAFIDKYPVHMKLFLQEMMAGATKYSEALPEHHQLKKAAWRNTASFPVIYAKDPVTGDVREIDSLLPVLKRIIPGLTNKKSRNYAEFLKRFPIFSPSEKSNTSEF